MKFTDKTEYEISQTQIDFEDGLITRKEQYERLNKIIDGLDNIDDCKLMLSIMYKYLN